MKMTVEVECTPEEARAFCGLPDVRPMQAAVMAQVERSVLDGMTAMSPESLLKTWMPFAPEGPIVDAMTRLFRPFLTQDLKPKP